MKAVRRRLLVPLAILSTVVPTAIVLQPALVAHAATFTVSTVVDEHLTTPTDTSCTSAHGCSLRAAIEAANNAGGSTTVTVPASEYDLTLGALNVGTFPGAQASYNISIVGGGTAANTKIKQTSAPSDRVVDVDPTLHGAVTFSISNVTITGGTDTLDGFGGGGIIAGSGIAASADSLSLTSVVIDGNSTILQSPAVANSPGGGLQFIGGHLTITSSTISNNSGAGGSGGGVYFEDVTGSGSVNITGSTFSGNTLDDTTSGPALLDGGGGLAIKGVTGTSATVDNDRFTSNTAKSTGSVAPVTGGGIYLVGPGSIKHSTFTLNHADGAVDPNHLEGGGGISASGGTAAIQFNRIVGNAASNGPSGLLVNLNDGNTHVNETRNWYGCNTPPSGSGCDTIYPTTSSANSLFDPWVKLFGSASPNKIRINQSTTLTGDLADSNGVSLNSSDVGAFTGLPVTFNSPVLGTIPDPQPEALNTSLAATATYNAGGVGGQGSAHVTVDNQTVTIGIVVLQPPSITKTFSPTSTAIGGASTATFSITNGNVVAINGSFTDTLPAGLVVAATPNVVNNCGGTVTATAGSTSISWSNAALPVGTCTISADVSSNLDNTYSNSVTIDSSDAGNGNTSSANVTVINPPHITKAFGAASVPLNGTTSLTFTVDSNSNQNLTLNGVAFTDTLPAGLVVATPGSLNSTCSGTASAVDGSSSVSLAGATVAPSSSCAMSVNVTGTTGGVKNNSVQVTSTNAGTGNTSNASITVAAPPVISKVFGAASVPVNGSTSLTFTIQNNNSTVSLSGIGFTDTLPSGLVISTPNGLSGSCGGGTITAVQGTNVITLSGATIAASSQCSFAVNVTATSPGDQNNTTGNVTSTEGGTGGTASASVTDVAPPSIAKAFNPTTIALNGTTALTFTLTNPAANTVAEAGVAFTDTLPTGLVVSTPNGVTNVCGGTASALAGSTSISLTGGSIAVNSSCTVVVNVTGTTSGQYTNTSGAVSSTNGGTGNTAAADLTVVSPPTITKAFGAATVPLNGSTSLTFNITNPNASVTLNGIAFTDSLPSGLVVAAPNGLSNTCGGTATAVAGSSSASLSGGTLAAGASCTVSANVTGTGAGVQNNSVQVTSTEGGTGNTSNATVTVVAPPVLVKAFGAASIPLNGSTSLTFTIQNNNTTVSLSGIGFSDTLPAGLVISTPNGLTGSCGGGTITATQATNVISLSGATIAPSSQCSFSVNVDGTSAGQQDNTTGNVTSTEGGTGGTASASVTVVAPPSIAKAFNPTVVSLNGTTVLTLTVTNPAANTVAETGVAFTDILPTGLVVSTPNGLTNTCNGTATAVAGSTAISLTGGSIPVNTSCTVVVNVTGTTSGQYTNTTGAVSSTNGGTGNTATANLSVASPPTITKAFGAAQIALNGSTSLTFTIQNPNASAALTGIGFTDSLPAGLVVATPSSLSNTCGGTATAAAGSSSASLSGGTLAAGASCTVSVNVTGTTAGVQNNSVQVTSTEGGTGNTSNATVTVVAPPVIIKAFGAASIPVNGTTSLTFTIQNNNPTVSLTGIGFSDTLPAGLAISTPNGLSGSCGGGTITATAGTNVVSLSGATLAQSTQCSFSVNVKAASAGQENNTTGNVTSTEGGTGGTASATVIDVAPPVIAKAFNPTTISLNGTTTLTLTLTNPAANTVAETGVAFTDTLPTGLVVSTPNGLTNGCNGTATAVAGSTSISLTGGTIPVNSSCTVVVNVTGTTSGQYTNTTGAVSSTNGGTGNTATANLSVASPPTITKAFGAATVPLNGSTSLTFNITNPNAGAALTGIAFTDSLPAGLIVATPGSLTNTCGGTATAAAGSSSVSLSGGTLAAGASCTVSVNVTGTTAGVQNNSVQVTSTEGGTGNTSSASVTVVAPPVIIKAFGAASIPLNGTTSLTFTIQNNNTTVSLTGIGFSDTLPGGLAISTPNGLTGSCGGGTITATAGTSVVSLSGATLAQSTQCSFSVNVKGTSAGQQDNTTGNVTSSEGGTGGTASASLIVVAPPSIAKAFNPTTIAVNGTTTLTITLTNPAANTVAEAGVAFTDTLPNGLVVSTPNGLTNGCNGTATAVAGSTSISLTGGSIPVNSSCTVVVSVTGTASGQFTNTTGAVSSTNGGTGNTASATVSTAAPPTINKLFGASTIPLNGSTSLTFNITNPNSGSTLTGIGFTDNLPGGLIVATPGSLVNTCGGTATAAAGSSSVSLSGGQRGGGASCTVSVNVTGTTAGVKNNSVQVTSTEGGAGNTSNASITIVAPPVITKAFGAASIPVSGTTSLTFTIQNNNATVSLSGIGFTDTLPGGLVISTPSGLTGTCGGGTVTATQVTNVVTLSGATLAQGASCTFSVKVTGTAAGQQNNTTGPVTSTEGGTGQTASASVNVVGGPVIAKAFNPTAIPLGSTTTLTFTIANPAANTVASTGVAFTDTLPSGLTIGGGSSTVCSGTLTTTAPSGIALSGATIAVNQSCVFSVTVTGAQYGQQTNITGAVSSTNGGTGNMAQAVMTVATPPVLTEAFGEPSIPLGGSTTLSITITNPSANPMALTSVNFDDVLSPGLDVAPNQSHAACGGWVKALPGTMPFSLFGGTLPAHSSCTLSIIVTGTAPGTQSSDAFASAAESGPGPPVLTTVVVTIDGYWLVASDGGIFPFGNAGGYGSTGNIRLNKPMVGMAATPDGGGYWLVASDGGIFPFGNAVGYGSTGNIKLNEPIVGMAATPDGGGYWLVASDGGIFPFGDAVGYGSTGNIKLNKPVVGMAATPDGGGYWLVASDGGIFPFGDAVGYGSTGNIKLNKPVVGMASTHDGGGYWLVASDGGIFPFGDAAGYGSTGNIKLNKPMVGMAATPDGGGYWLVASDGGIFPFGDAIGDGSTGGMRLNQPVVGMASTGH